jgi:hypothetical protein
LLACLLQNGHHAGDSRATKKSAQAAHITVTRLMR